MSEVQRPRHCGGTAVRPIYEYEAEAEGGETKPGATPWMPKYTRGEWMVKRCDAHREGKPGCGAVVRVIDVDLGRGLVAPCVICPHCDAPIKTPAGTEGHDELG